MKKKLDYLNMIFPIFVITFIGMNESRVIELSLIRLVINIAFLILALYVFIINIITLFSKETS